MSKRHGQARERHHIVPQMLLRHFATGRGKNKRLFVFDKHTAAVRFQSIRDVAHERGFYSVKRSDGVWVDLEPNLSEIESRASASLDALVTAGTLAALPRAKYVELLALVALQFLRGPMNRQMFMSINEGVLKKLANDRPLSGDLAHFEKYTKEDAARDATICVAKMLRPAVNMLLHKIGILFSAPTDSFYVSDTPVALHNMQDAGAYGNLGLMVKGIEIYMPISARYVLGLMCPYLVSTLYANPRFKAAVDERKPIACDDGENVTFYNSLQVIFAERFVFSKVRNFELITRMLQDHPKYRYGLRIRTD